MHVLDGLSTSLSVLSGFFPTLGVHPFHHQLYLLVFYNYLHIFLAMFIMLSIYSLLMHFVFDTLGIARF